MRMLWKRMRRWLAADDLRPGRRRTRLAFDWLEGRETPAGNLALTQVALLDANNQTIASPIAGERLTLRIDWSASGLDPGNAYVVRATIAGIALDAGPFTGSSSGNLSTTLTGWYA